MDINSFFENVKESGIFNQELQDLLDRIMEIKNPMKFNDDFATEEQMDALEAEMDRFELLMPKMSMFLVSVKDTKIVEASGQVFI